MHVDGVLFSCNWVPFVWKPATIITQKMKFSVKVFFSKCYQIRIFLQIWLHLLNKTLMENFIFCAVYVTSGEGNFILPI